MSKAAHSQRPLFDPWLAWDQLADCVREQALDVLTALCLEIIEIRRIGDQTSHSPTGAESTESPSQRSPLQGVTSR